VPPRSSYAACNTPALTEVSGTPMELSIDKGDRRDVLLRALE
jgi:hypothetical protein